MTQCICYMYDTINFIGVDEFLWVLAVFGLNALTGISKGWKQNAEGWILFHTSSFILPSFYCPYGHLKRMKAEFRRMNSISYFILHPLSFILPLRAFQKDEGWLQKDEFYFILHPSSLIRHIALTGISKGWRLNAEGWILFHTSSFIPLPSFCPYEHFKRMKAECRRMTGRQKD